MHISAHTHTHTHKRKTCLDAGPDTAAGVSRHTAMTNKIRSVCHAHGLVCVSCVWVFDCVCVVERERESDNGVASDKDHNMLHYKTGVPLMKVESDSVVSLRPA